MLGLGAAAIAALGTGTTAALRDDATPGPSAPGRGLAAHEHARAREALRPWDDPGVWEGGRVPGRGDSAVLRGDAVLAGQVEVGALRVAPGASLTFAGDRDVTLTGYGNVVVEGALWLEPAGPSVTHRLRFAGVEEHRAQGGGTEVLPTDVGLWVMGAGELTLRGSPRDGWARLAGGVAAGARRLELAGEPRGWRPGDELVVVPSAPPSDAASHQGYDRVTLERLEGRLAHVTAPVRHDHPAAEVRPGMVLTAEVLNLTRNVVVGGTAEGRAHVLLHTRAAPRLAHTRIEHAGPQARQGLVGEDGGPLATPVLGRYGLHFHHCGEATRGAEVEGVVVTGCGNHAFVAHESHGIRLRDCVAHDTTLSAFWWDAVGLDDASHDTIYERCVASLTRGVDVAVPDAPSLAERIGGFELLRGRGNAAVDCVSVGGGGRRDSAGFVWPEEAEGVWVLRDCVSHNHRHHGSYAWQNTSQPHEVERLVAYHNGGHGIVHGAYSNNYTYRDCAAYGNAGAALLRRANSAGPEARQEWHRCRFDAAGQGEHALLNGPHAYPPSRELGDVLFRECEFLGGTVAAVGLADATDIRSWCALDFVDCRFDEPRFAVGDAYEATRWRVQSGRTATEIDWSRGGLRRAIDPFENAY